MSCRECAEKYEEDRKACVDRDFSIQRAIFGNNLNADARTNE